MKKMLLSILLVLPLLTPLVSAAGTTRYVSDQLEITMRNGQGVKFAIRKMLMSGTKLEVIETDPAGYSKVKTAKGVTGWVLSRYLTNSASARDRVAGSEQKVVNLQLEVAKYKEELGSLVSRNTDAGSENMSLKETAQRLSTELDDLRKTASNAMGLENENRQLKEKLQQTDHDMQLLIIENSGLKDNDAKNWFLIGAAVLFGGVLLGLILPRLRLQKKQSWNNF